MNSHICSAYAWGTKARRAQFIASAISRFNCKLDHDAWKPSLACLQIEIYNQTYTKAIITSQGYHLNLDRMDRNTEGGSPRQHQIR